MRRLWLLPLLCATLIACRSEKTPHSIAVAADFSGDTKAIGAAIRFGAKYAEKSDLKVLEFDDENSPAKAIANALKIAADKSIVAVIGHASSGMTASAQSVYARFGVPLLMPVATASNITTRALEKYGSTTAFRLVPTNDTQAAAITDLAIRKATEHKKISPDSAHKPLLILIHERNPYATDLANEIRAQLKQKPNEISYPNPFEEPDAPVQPDRYVTAISTYNADAVIYVGYYKKAAILINEIRLKHPNLPIVLADGSFQTELLQAVSPVENQTDVFITFPAPDWTKRKEVTELVTRFRQNGDRGFSLSFAPFAVDAVDLISRALSASDNADPRRRIIDSLSGLETKHRATTAEYRFNKYGDAEVGQFFIYTLSDGAFIEAE